MKRIVLLVLIVLIGGCVDNNPVKVSETRDIMGTVITITVLSDDPAKAQGAISSAFAEIARIDALMSTYRNDSQISVLNREGILENASPDLIFNLERSIFYSELSDGAFDITVQPVLDLYKKAYTIEKRAPTEEEIAESLERVDYRNIIIEDNSVRFKKEGMKATLGGIAKGYAVDRAIDALQDNGVQRALVNAGGDMRAMGKKSPTEDWQIALQDPRNKSNQIMIIELNNKAVATSGDYERYFVNKTAHHIIDPKTGYSAVELISVTVVANKAMDADAIATAVFVLGPEEGMALIEEIDSVEGLLITENKTIIKSSGF